MKLCFSTLGCTERTLDEVLTLANTFRMDGIELRGIGGCLQNGGIPDFSETNATKTKSAFRESGVCPVVLGTSCCFHTPNAYTAAMAEGAESIRIAARLGVPYIRVFGNNITEDRAVCIRRVTEGIAALCRIAAPLGVSVLLEVHGNFNTPENLEPVLESLAAENSFGLIWDLAHSHRGCGGAWRPLYGLIRPFVRHVHLKDVCDATNALTLPGLGDIPLTEILTQLTEDGYAGYVSLEWERHWIPQLPPIEEALTHFTGLCRGSGR